MVFRPAIIPAAILGALTVGVFYVLRDFGPESALRKFHFAAISRDLEALDDVCDSAADPDATRYLVTELQSAARRGARYEVGKVVRKGDQAVATVIYRYPGQGIEIPTLWVVEKKDSRWRVNPHLTMTQTRNMLLGR